MAEQQMKSVDAGRLVVEVDPLAGRRAALRPVAAVEVVPRPAELLVSGFERAERGVVGDEVTGNRNRGSRDQEEQSASRLRDQQRPGECREERQRRQVE